MQNKISFTEAIRDATLQSMEADSTIFVMGLGVSYPNGADGTTKGLKEKFPTQKRVSEKLSENTSKHDILNELATVFSFKNFIY